MNRCKVLENPILCVDDQEFCQLLDAYVGVGSRGVKAMVCKGLRRIAGSYRTVRNARLEARDGIEPTYAALQAAA
jgi:hypothetical protein